MKLKMPQKDTILSLIPRAKTDNSITSLSSPSLMMASQSQSALSATRGIPTTLALGGGHDISGPHVTTMTRQDTSTSYVSSGVGNVMAYHGGGGGRDNSDLTQNVLVLAHNSYTLSQTIFDHTDAEKKDLKKTIYDIAATKTKYDLLVNTCQETKDQVEKLKNKRKVEKKANKQKIKGYKDTIAELQARLMMIESGGGAGYSPPLTTLKRKYLELAGTSEVQSDTKKSHIVPRDDEQQLMLVETGALPSTTTTTPTVKSTPMGPPRGRNDNVTEDNIAHLYHSVQGSVFPPYVGQLVHFLSTQPSSTFEGQNNTGTTPEAFVVVPLTGLYSCYSLGALIYGVDMMDRVHRPIEPTTDPLMVDLFEKTPIFLKATCYQLERTSTLSSYSPFDHVLGTETGFLPDPVAFKNENIFNLANILQTIVMMAILKAICGSLITPPVKKDDGEDIDEEEE